MCTLEWGRPRPAVRGAVVFRGWARPEGNTCRQLKGRPAYTIVPLESVRDCCRGGALTTLPLDCSPRQSWTMKDSTWNCWLKSSFDFPELPCLMSRLWSWRLICVGLFQIEVSGWLTMMTTMTSTRETLEPPRPFPCSAQLSARVALWWSRWQRTRTKKSLFCHSSIFTTTLNTVLKQREHKVWDIDFKIYTCNYFLYFCLLHKWRVSIKKSFKRNIQQTAGIVLVSPSPVKIKWNLIQISAIFYSHIYTKTITQLITILDLTHVMMYKYTFN